MRYSVVLIAGLAACDSAAAPPSSTPATPSTSTASAITTASAPPPAPAPATACLMTHICGCNVGCARIPISAAELREGTRTTAQTGPYAGKELIVTKEVDATGGSVFALSDREHSQPCERDTPQSKSLMGFLCAAKDSGPVPTRACAHGCE